MRETHCKLALRWHSCSPMDSILQPMEKSGVCAFVAPALNKVMDCVFSRMLYMTTDVTLQYIQGIVDNNGPLSLTTCTSSFNHH
jgi:hypothetical protein